MVVFLVSVFQGLDIITYKQTILNRLMGIEWRLVG